MTGIVIFDVTSFFLVKLVKSDLHLSGIFASSIEDKIEDKTG